MATTTITSDEERLADPIEERNLIACVIRSQEAWLRVSDSVTVEEFVHPVNAALWTVIDDMREGAVVPSPVSVTDKLPRDIKDRVDGMGGWDYINTLMSIPIDPLNVEHHAKRLHELTILRRGKQAGETIQRLASKGGPSEPFLQKVEEIVNEIPGTVGTDVIKLGSIVEDYVTEKRLNPKKLSGYSTGYPLLDSVVEGLHPGRLYVLGARTGQGKSVFCLNLVKNLAIDQEIPVLYISTEQTKEDEISRLVSIVAKMPETYLDNGTFISMNNYPQQVSDAELQIKDAPIWFSHDPMFSPQKLYRTIKKFVLTEKIKVVFFDYIRIPVGDVGSRDKWALVGDLAYGLKAIASDLGVPVISAVQVNRDGAEQFVATGEIDSTAFALSDQIVQASSVAMVMRPLNKSEKDKNPDFLSKRVITFAKNRHGSMSTKLLYMMETGYVKLSELSTIASH
jgi:replicative DNA helicase